jgi:hypothetical protein
VLAHDGRQRSRLLAMTSTIQRLEAVCAALQDVGGGAGPCRVM